MNNEETLLLDYEFEKRGQKHKLKVVLVYYNNIPKVDIREYYFDDISKTFKHTKSGVQLDKKKTEALHQALEQNSVVIEKHLLSENNKKWADEVRLVKTNEGYCSEYEFFRTANKPGSDELIINKGHPFGAKFMRIYEKKTKDEDTCELIFLMESLLLSYHKSLSQYDSDAKIRAEDIIDDINSKWSVLLKRILRG